jgi:uncharacterized OB-fold protein
MKTELSTCGSGFADDALPFADLATLLKPAFELVDGHVMLKGGVSRSSGSLAFPQRDVSMDGGLRDLEPVLFGPRARLYSFATVHVSSTRPTPYTIGYIDFDNGVRVLANIETEPGHDLVCDETVELRADGARWFVVPVNTNTNSQGAV